MYGFDYSCGTISLTIHYVTSAEDVSRHSTGVMAVDRQVLFYGKMVLFLEECRHLKVRQRLDLESDVNWIQQHILVRLIVREDKAVIGEAKRVRLSKLANKVNGAVCHDSTFVEIMKTTLNFTDARCVPEYVKLYGRCNPYHGYRERNDRL